MKEKEGKEDEKKRKKNEEKANNNNNPGSTYTHSVWQFACNSPRRLYFVRQLSNDATFPFMEMNFLSAILLAPGLLHTFMLGIIIYSAWPGASILLKKKDLRPSKVEA